MKKNTCDICNYLPPFVFCAFSLVLFMLASCTNNSNKVVSEATNKAKYYESTPAPSYIQEQFGPFGPQEKSYTPPAGAIYVAPDGVDSNSGTSIGSPTTLSKAIGSVKTGSVIVLRGGVYRNGGLTFNKKITIQPYLNERPVIKGSEVADKWSKKGSFWVTKWEKLFQNEPPRWFNQERHKYKALYYGDLVMIDGEIYTPVDSLNALNKGNFYCDYAENEVYIAEDPAGKMVEITAHEYGLVRVHDATADKEGPTILGLDIMQYALSCISVEGDDPYRKIEQGASFDAPIKTRIEDCRILYCGKTGLHITSPESYIAYNDISWHGSVALMIRMSHNTVFEHNTVHQSNAYKLKAYPAGIKVFNQASNFTVRNNYFSDMSCVAVWYDVGHHDGVIVKNYIRNCGVGLKIEISNRTFIAGNVFEKSNMWLCNSADCFAYNNTMIDSRIDLWRNNRGNRGGHNKNFSFDHATTGAGAWGYHGHQVANNIFTGRPRGDFYFLIEDNNDFDKNFHADVLEGNLFLKEAEWTFNAQFQPKELPVTKYASLTDFSNVYGEYEDNNIQLDIEQDSLFFSKSIGDYRLKEVSGLPKGRKIPISISKLLKWDSSKTGIGAFAQPKQ